MLDGLIGAGASSSLFASAPTKAEGQFVDYGVAAQLASDQRAYNEMMRQQMQAQQKSAHAHIGRQAQARTFNPNNDPAYNIPLSQLVTLWQAKHGDKWVEHFDDDFWISARARLRDNHMLESVNGWYRIKEDV